MANPDSQNVDPKTVSFAEFVLLMATLTALPAMSIDIVLPALGILPGEFPDATIANTPLVVSIFFAGMGVGQLLFGPLCDGLGRRPSIFIGMVLFVFGTLICLITTSFTILLLGRFLQAVGASAPRIATLAIVRDRYEGNEMARVFSFIITLFIVVPMIAPLLGHGIILAANWHWIFILLLVYSVGASTWFYFRQDETLTEENASSLSPKAIAKELVRILSIKSVAAYTLATGAAFGLIATYVSSAQHVFQNLYRTGQNFPYIFAALACSVGIASFANGKLVRKFGMFKLVLAAMSMNLACSVSLLLLSLAHDGLPPLPYFLLISVLINFGNGILLGNLSALAMQPLAHSAGFGAALISSLSTLVSVPIAVIIGKFIGHSLTPYATGFMLSSCAAILLAYWANQQSQHAQPKPTSIK